MSSKPDDNGVGEAETTAPRHRTRVFNDKCIAPEMFRGFEGWSDRTRTEMNCGKDTVRKRVIELTVPFMYPRRMEFTVSNRRFG